MNSYDNCQSLDIFLLFLAQKRTLKSDLIDECIRPFKQEGGKVLLLFDNEEKINLQRLDMTFYAPINYFRKLFEYFLCVIFRHILTYILASAARKMVLLKFETIKRD